MKNYSSRSPRPKISVIIPAYNEARDIAACLQSLLRQDYPSFEIIVVDDGSTDTTASAVKKFPVRLIQQPHSGPGQARNLAASHAKGKILVFADADMTFAPDFLSRLTTPIQVGSTIGTFSHEELLANSTNIWARYWNLNKHLPADRMHPPGFPDTQPVFRAILKSEFDRVGGFDPIGYDDDYTLSAKLGQPATAAPDAVFYHRNPDSLAEVWRQARWAARRRYKLGPVGRLITIIRTLPPVSLAVGLMRALQYREPGFIIFKLVFDTAVLVSVNTSFFNKFNYK